MLDILIVEDDTNKLKKIMAALVALPGVNIDNIHSVLDRHSARKILAEKSFDLLILDISLPNRIDQDAQPDGGLRLLEELDERDVYRIPASIIGMTAFADIYDRINAQFSKRALSLIKFENDSSAWVESISSRVRQIIASKAAVISSKTHQSFLAIVCGLDEPELSAVLRNGWTWESVSFPNDSTEYHKTIVQIDGMERIIYAAAAPRMGMTASAVLSVKMIEHFRPKYLAMAGIAAGIRGKVQLGDVIAVDPSWDWGSGKWTVKDKNKHFLIDPHQLPLDRNLRSKIRQLKGRSDLLSQVRDEWPGEKPIHVLSLHLGPVASGASVVATSLITNQIVMEQHRKLIGIEMEAYGVFAAADECTEPRPAVFVMKSVVDFADEEKSDGYHYYAAYTSARVLRCFVEKIL